MLELVDSHCCHVAFLRVSITYANYIWTLILGDFLAPDTCVVDMGMQNGYIRDDMISASSSRDASHAPQRARLNSATSWLAARDDTHQFLQVDLLAPRYVTGVTTQGRSDAPSYVSSYRFLYSVDGVEWSVYREERDMDKVVSGINLYCCCRRF